ncbi:acyl-CoA dehydrogenase family protein [Pseudorhodoferax sp.]|uniref:acyl-CoA dehydrogenase family protein n=1 Tax=Pseudorhodoferax sp. TaxID=1993553 RepID=UPI002DD65185|nr:acyl-CoA dehydrogenase family protein [Pseudorhodoferax sp.]
MDAQPTETELEEFRATVRKFAVGAFAADAARWDEDEAFPAKNRQLLAELGYLGLVIPEAYGGSGASIAHASVFLEEIARVCFNTGLICQLALNGPSRAIEVLGNAEQKARWLPKCASGEYMFGIGISEPGAGSAVTDLTTTATEDGDAYIVHGQKAFCTGGAQATHVLVFARFGQASGAKGIGALVVEKGTPGFDIGHPAPKMGGRGVAEVELFFDHCRVPKENVLVPGDPASSKSFRLLMSSFGPERVGNAAMCLGVAQAAFELAVSYSSERMQFGRPICEFQGIQWKVADMATQIHAARLMIRHAATQLEGGFPRVQDATFAKLYANEMVQRVTNEALQIHGHYGYTREFPLERMVRDARGFALGGGTVEILRNTVAALVYGRSFDQRRS